MTGGRLAWLLTGAVAAVTGIGTTAAGVWYGTQRPLAVHTRTSAVSYQGQPDRVLVQIASGNITVTAGPPGRIEVTGTIIWSGSRPRTATQWRGHEFVIGQDCPGGMFSSTCTVNYRVAVPPGVALNLSSANGDITVMWVRAAQVVANSSAGNVALTFAVAPAAVRAGTAFGNVTILVPRGGTYSVEADTADGNSDVTVAQDPGALRSLIATSESGNIKIAYG